MEKSAFTTLYRETAEDWYKSVSIPLNDPQKAYIKSTYAGEIADTMPVSELCTIKPNYAEKIYAYYESTKQLVKELYFASTEKKLSKYKRAAVIAFIILQSDPLEYKYKVKNGLDCLFLKQRLAFAVAIQSIVQSIPKEKRDSLRKPIYDFDRLKHAWEKTNNEDSFLLSVYKDMFFSEINENYNILTMANVFGLVTEYELLLNKS